MGCTKSQLLALLSMIEKKIALCDDVECALDVVSKVKEHIEELAEGEILRELGLAL